MAQSSKCSANIFIDSEVAESLYAASLFSELTCI